LAVDDDPHCLVALSALLTRPGQNVVTARSGEQALRRLLEQDFALILLDVHMPELDGFATAGLIRQRDRSRGTPIIFMTASNQSDAQVSRGYSLGAVDFIFKPIVPEVLRAKVAVFVELARQTQELRRQAEAIRQAERREHEGRLADARQRWEAERLQRSNERLTFLAGSANRLLLGNNARALLPALLGELCEQLALDVYLLYLLDEAEQLHLEAHQGVPPELARARAVLPVGSELSGTVAASQARLVLENVKARNDGQTAPLCELALSAFVCYPLLAEGRLIGTLGFGSRTRPTFEPDQLAMLQLVSGQLAMALERELLIDTLQARATALCDADRRKDEFLAMLAHELRNPLAPIVNALHLMQCEDALPETLERARATMSRQVLHLVRLVDDLLDVSRITKGKIELRREHADLRTVIEHAMATSQPLLEARRHRLTVELPVEPVALLADPTRLAQVISNLLNNAAKYSEPGSQIRLVVTVEAGEVIVRVTDAGIGIRPEALPRIFEPFVQADRTSDRVCGGLGLGLTLVRRLVELHGGTVEARSEGPGRGSEFEVRLPRTAELLAGSLAAAGGAPAIERRRGVPSLAPPVLRVVIIDDNQDIRETLVALLELVGHTAVAAEDGTHGIELVTALGPEVALVDIGLPDIDGYQVARALRSKMGARPLRLYAMSGYGQAEDCRRSVEAGFDAHLVKPVEPELLLALLAESTALLAETTGSPRCGVACDPTHGATAHEESHG
jgi:signal transduction histidine kinase/DNA-binding response OmpR family regulator